MLEEGSRMDPESADMKSLEEKRRACGQKLFNFVLEAKEGGYHRLGKSDTEARLLNCIKDMHPDRNSGDVFIEEAVKLLILILKFARTNFELSSQGKEDRDGIFDAWKKLQKKYPEYCSSETSGEESAPLAVEEMEEIADWHVARYQEAPIFHLTFGELSNLILLEDNPGLREMLDSFGPRDISVEQERWASEAGVHDFPDWSKTDFQRLLTKVLEKLGGAPTVINFCLQEQERLRKLPGREDVIKRATKIVELLRKFKPYKKDQLLLEHKD